MNAENPHAQHSPTAPNGGVPQVLSKCTKPPCTPVKRKRGHYLRSISGGCRERHQCFALVHSREVQALPSSHMGKSFLAQTGGSWSLGLVPHTHFPQGKLMGVRDLQNERAKDTGPVGSEARWKTYLKVNGRNNSRPGAGAASGAAVDTCGPRKELQTRVAFLPEDLQGVCRWEPLLEKIKF